MMNLFNRERILIPEHPRSNTKGYVYKSILIAEKVLGKPLPLKAVVHHVDHDFLNNSKDNLVICEDTMYHNRIHKRERSLNATGSVNNSYCNRCHAWKNIEKFDVQANGITRRGWCKAKHGGMK